MKFYDENIEALIRFAEDSIYDGDCARGKEFLINGLLEEPGYPKLHYTLGWMFHYYQIDEVKAERHYRYAIHFDDTYFEAYEALVELYFQERKYLDISELMYEASHVDGIEKDFVFETLGKAAELLNEFGEAVKYYRKAQVYCMDNTVLKELKQNMKRAKFKRFSKRFKKWQRIK